MVSSILQKYMYVFRFYTALICKMPEVSKHQEQEAAKSTIENDDPKQMKTMKNQHKRNL